jgi:uncharacterized membrane protein
VASIGEEDAAEIRANLEATAFVVLVLSCLAALQAPSIMMSQNRQAERERLESTRDYETDPKAKIEIASLHDKVNHLLHAQWERVVELQQMQIDLLTELTARR